MKLWCYASTSTSSSPLFRCPLPLSHSCYWPKQWIIEPIQHKHLKHDPFLIYISSSFGKNIKNSVSKFDSKSSTPRKKRIFNTQGVGNAKINWNLWLANIKLGNYRTIHCCIFLSVEATADLSQFCLATRNACAEVQPNLMPSQGKNAVYVCVGPKYINSGTLIRRNQ